jgi:hypothetical protein
MTAGSARSAHRAQGGHLRYLLNRDDLDRVFSHHPIKKPGGNQPAGPQGNTPCGVQPPVLYRPEEQMQTGDPPSSSPPARSRRGARTPTRSSRICPLPPAVSVPRPPSTSSRCIWRRSRRRLRRLGNPARIRSIITSTPSSRTTSSAARPLLAGQGLSLVVSVRNTTRLPDRQTSKGGTERAVEVLLVARLIHESGEWLEGDGVGRGPGPRRQGGLQGHHRREKVPDRQPAVDPDDR